MMSATSIRESAKRASFGMVATPKVTGLSKAAVSRLAETIATDLRYFKHKDIHQIVYNLGGDVQVVDYWLEDNRAGSLKVRKEGDFSIYVPAHTTVVRDNFTIAHELGHYVLHYLYPAAPASPRGPFVATRYGKGREEWEANWFAAAFLMPKGPFKRHYKTSKGNQQSLAKHFKVSTAAVWVRTQSLGLNG